MMDHYEMLGVHDNASKEEIKHAFRKLAMQFHPDKHAHSPKYVRDTVTVKFKKLSEAYEVLIDDSKRADYNSRNNYYNYRRGRTSSNGGFGNYDGPFGYGYSPNPTPTKGKSAGTAFQFDVILRYFTARSFLRSVAFAGVLIGGIYIFDAGEDALWQKINSGKSFEEALESVKRAKAVKEAQTPEEG